MMILRSIYLPIYILLCVCFISCEKEPTTAPVVDPPIVVNNDTLITLTQTTNNQTINRKFTIRYPKNKTKTSYPVVFFFHANGDSSTTFLKNKEITQLIDNEEFIGVFPDGHLNSWNLGREASKADDVGFVNQIKTILTQQPLIDHTNLYAVGISNGALFVNILGKSTRLFKGIAPILSQQSTIIVQIQPLQALSVYQVNGTKDPTIPLEGGESGVGHEFVSAKESAKNWSNHFNCSINPLIKVDTWGSFAVTSYTYSDCTRKHKVSYHLVQDAQHEWNFGENDPIFTRIWAFFKEE